MSETKQNKTKHSYRIFITNLITTKKNEFEFLKKNA
jgi:hypothetical protein